MSDLSLYKIVIVTRSMNSTLYRLSQATIDLPFESIRLQGTTADGYLYELMNMDADYIINIDEDAFVLDNAVLLELLEYCIVNDIDACGFPDGGVLPIREHNPLIMNPFFNIFHVKQLKEQFSCDKMQEYIIHKKKYEEKTPQQLIRGKYEYDNYEPYYPFFLWISQNFNTLYLDADEYSDSISTLLKDYKGFVFLIHTWYSRDYGKVYIHTKRINDIVRYAMKNNRKNDSLFCVQYALMKEYYLRIGVAVKRCFRHIPYIGNKI